MSTASAQSPMQSDDAQSNRRQVNDQPILSGGHDTNQARPWPKKSGQAALKPAAAKPDGFPYFEFFADGYLY